MVGVLLVVRKDIDNHDDSIFDDDDNLGSNCRLQAGVFGALLLAECWGWDQTKIMMIMIMMMVMQIKMMVIITYWYLDIDRILPENLALLVWDDAFAKESLTFFVEEKHHFRLIFLHLHNMSVSGSYCLLWKVSSAGVGLLWEIIMSRIITRLSKKIISE